MKTTDKTDDIKFISYEHHGAIVTAREDLAGKHREMCLCHKCRHFHPGSPDNCIMASELYDLCCRYNMTTPVFECPSFDRDEV